MINLEIFDSVGLHRIAISSHLINLELHLLLLLQLSERYLLFQLHFIPSPFLRLLPLQDNDNPVSMGQRRVLWAPPMNVPPVPPHPAKSIGHDSAFKCHNVDSKSTIRGPKFIWIEVFPFRNVLRQIRQQLLYEYHIHPEGYHLWVY